jgi:DNA-binding transcriptional regulator YiaG
MKPNKPNDNRAKDRKPWHLHGQEARIVEMRDDKGLSWEHIAVLLNASKTGVMGAYQRRKRELAQAADTDEGQTSRADESAADAPTAHSTRKGKAA